ncbi:MAG: hypothetical protein F4X39_02930 [Acidobacteriia bacterium]|nr:hypothetical protein [Terriglobia bacterium]
MRGPSGRGASRLARTVALDRTSNTASRRQEALAVVSRAFPVKRGERQMSRGLQSDQSLSFLPWRCSKTSISNVFPTATHRRPASL